MKRRVAVSSETLLSTNVHIFKLCIIVGLRWCHTQPSSAEDTSQSYYSLCCCFLFFCHSKGWWTPSSSTICQAVRFKEGFILLYAISLKRRSAYWGFVMFLCSEKFFTSFVTWRLLGKSVLLNAWVDKCLVVAYNNFFFFFCSLTREPDVMVRVFPIPW